MKVTLEKWFKLLKSTKDIVYLDIKISRKPDKTLQMLQKHYVNALLDYFNWWAFMRIIKPISHSLGIMIHTYTQNTLMWNITLLDFK
jgi:hypothetical protein